MNIKRMALDVLLFLPILLIASWGEQWPFWRILILAMCLSFVETIHYRRGRSDERARVVS